MDVQTAIHVRPPVLHFRQGVPADLGRFIRAHPEDRGKDLQSVCLKACRNISATLLLLRRGSHRGIPDSHVNRAMLPMSLNLFSLGHKPMGCLYILYWMSSNPAFSSFEVRSLWLDGKGRLFFLIASSMRLLHRMTPVSLGSDCPESLWCGVLTSANST